MLTDYHKIKKCLVKNGLSPTLYIYTFSSVFLYIYTIIVCLCIFIHFSFALPCSTIVSEANQSRTVASVPRPPSANVSRLPAIDIGPLWEDGARRPSSYYDIPCLPHYIVPCLHVPLLSRTVASVPRPPAPNASRPPTFNASRPPSPSVPVLSSSFIRPLLLTNIKNQWLRVINV